MTNTFISLITKKANAKELKGLRHNINIRDLQAHLKNFNHRIKYHGTTGGREAMNILKWRKIMDASFVANELVNSRVKGQGF